MNKSAAKKMKQRSAGKPDIELGKRIRLRRVEQRISQAELGDQLGVSFQQVQKYEKGVNRVGAARLQQIATALDVPVTFFYDGDGKAREVESLLFLDSSFSLRLLRAYSKIKDQSVQRQLESWRSCERSSAVSTRRAVAANPALTPTSAREAIWPLGRVKISPFCCDVCSKSFPAASLPYCMIPRTWSISASGSDGSVLPRHATCWSGRDSTSLEDSNVAAAGSFTSITLSGT
jgi:transcriptional regulator with XRE-family HTH domain